ADPEAPQVVMPLLLVTRGTDRPHLKSARVEPLGDALDAAALAGRIPAFESDQDRAAAVPVRELRAENTQLELVELALVGLLVDDRLRVVERIEDAHGFS